MNEKSPEILDLPLFFPYRLSVLQQQVSNAVSKHYHDEFDLNRIEWRVMATLAMYDNISARDICEFTHVAKMQVSRALARLKKKNLVIQKISDIDHRATQLTLTDEGRKVYRWIVPMVKTEELKILAHLSVAEQGQLAKILTKLEHALD
jgi:DNA-binding MarR family transcriptional regulator